ncbi:hypothetical protein CRG98_019847 [Punica granatum]|uniref:Transposase MuDR plant domain-containing protein n=1 Tax=Punica granatum TaxID=22663 RepID=A0A2I0JTX1_PUNGR|nr:hypothetical protein CRG98_019847 [Punica granatum]
MELISGQFELKNLRKEFNKIIKQVAQLRISGGDATEMIASTNENKREEKGNNPKRIQESQRLRLLICVAHGFQIVVRLSPTTADMAISNDEEEGYISEELADKCISNDDNGEEELRKYPEFDENATFGEVQLELHMLFPNLTMFKKAVSDYNIAVRRMFKFVKNDNERVRGKCRSEGANERSSVLGVMR